MRWQGTRHISCDEHCRWRLRAQTACADVSLDQWLALTPPKLVSAHLKTNEQLLRALRKQKVPVVPA